MNILSQGRVVFEKVDVWSVGLVVGEMGLLSPLAPGNDTGDQIGKVTFQNITKC